MAQLVAQLKAEATPSVAGEAPTDPPGNQPGLPNIPLDGLALAGLLGARRREQSSSAALTLDKLLSVNPTLQNAQFTQGGIQGNQGSSQG